MGCLYPSEAKLLRASWLAERLQGVEVVRKALSKVSFTLVREEARRCW